MPEFIKVAKKKDIAPGTSKAVVVGGQDVAVFNVSGKFYALRDFCPHRGGPLSEGPIKGSVVTCGWHGWDFNIKDGSSVTMSGAKVACYEVQVEGDDILVST
jgi:nitrite reductase (NADH) small subunit